MYIASKKRKENIAEYLLYMWQIEDLIRANNLDIDSIERTIIGPMHPTDTQRKELSEWYESLIDMMRREGVEKSGHLQLNKNTLSQLVALHQTLLADTRFPDYTAEFYKTLPYIIELRAKAGDHAAGEIETCFNALYGILLMRLQGKQITEGTAAALAQISHFVAILARDFHLDEADKLFPHPDAD